MTHLIIVPTPITACETCDGTGVNPRSDAVAEQRPMCVPCQGWELRGFVEAGLAGVDGRVGR